MTVVVLHRTVCHYQVESLVKLAAILKSKGITLKIFSGMLEAEQSSLPPVLFNKLSYLAFPVQIGGLDDKLVILPGLLYTLIKNKPKLIVSEDICFMPNSLVVWAYSKLSGAPYLVRGLGVIPGKKPSRLRRFLEPLITLFRKGAAGFLCYSTHAADYYSQRYQGPCYVFYNSTLSAHTPAQVSELSDLISQKYSGDARPPRIAFIGRLLAQKRVDLLLQAAARLGCQVDILGDGPELPALRAKAVELGITDKVVFHGQVSDLGVKAEIFRKADIGVLPGLGGLAIQEMMWHGLPVVTSHADGTEKDLIIDGVTGFFVENMTIESLCAALSGFVSLEPQAKRAMAQETLRIISTKFNVDAMTNAYAEGISKTLCP
jgi:glycosyltransferase involved in cell wall biosynthesis